MPVIDDRGRLFGRVNVIDFAVVLFVVALVPLAYAAYALFRPTPPHIVSVSPSTAVYKAGVEQKVTITASWLRPFLRAQIGTYNTRGFEVTSARTADVRFMDLPPGTYDIVLFDESQEVARLPKALKITPRPVDAFGSFDAPGPQHTTLRVTCDLSPDNDCLIDGQVVATGKTATLTIPGTTTRAPFHVDLMRTDSQWVAVNVRLIGLPESLARAKVGDVDGHVDPASPEGPTPRTVVSGAQIVSLGALEKNQGQMSVTTSRPQTAGELTAYNSMATTLTVDAKPAQLLVPIDPATLKYREVQVRPGFVIPFETNAYRMQAIVISMGEAGK
jgi:hypothetical protein